VTTGELVAARPRSFLDVVGLPSVGCEACSGLVITSEEEDGGEVTKNPSIEGCRFGRRVKDVGKIDW
jgi:hypothetical protein